MSLAQANRTDDLMELEKNILHPEEVSMLINDPERTTAIKKVFADFKENQERIELEGQSDELPRGLDGHSGLVVGGSGNVDHRIFSGDGSRMSYSGVHAIMNQHLRVCDILSVEIIEIEV